MQEALEDALAACDLSPAQWGILRILWKYPGVSGADIARYANVTPASVATMLKRLEKAGLIIRESTQGGVIETYLTPAGKESLLLANEIAEAVEVKCFTKFTSEEKHQFDLFLQRLIPEFETQLHF